MTANSFLATLRDYPNQFTRGIQLARASSVTSGVTRSARDEKLGFENVVAAGMGGSALATDFVNAFLKGKPCVNTHRDYGLPDSVSKKTLFFALSYSGNTEETLSTVRAAVTRGAKIVCVASGGELERIALRKKLSLVKLPPGLQPRCATGYFFSVILSILHEAGLTRDYSRDLTALTKKLEKKRVESEKKGAELAAKLRDAIPLVYSSSEWWSVARAWKIKFNENAKIPSFYAVLPELNHNEVAGFSENRGRRALANFHAVFLRDAASDARVLKRFLVTRELLRELGVNSSVVEMKGVNALEKMFSTAWLGDFTAFNLALARGVDPEQVPVVEYFKKKLAEKS